MAREMTPQERAEQVVRQYYGFGATNLIDLISAALTATRRAALLEAMDAVGNEMLEETPTNEPDEAYCRAIDHALKALDRLAQEG